MLASWLLFVVVFLYTAAIYAAFGRIWWPATWTEWAAIVGGLALVCVFAFVRAWATLRKGP